MQSSAAKSITEQQAKPKSILKDKTKTTEKGILDAIQDSNVRSDTLLNATLLNFSPPKTHARNSMTSILKDPSGRSLLEEIPQRESDIPFDVKRNTPSNYSAQRPDMSTANTIPKNPSKPNTPSRFKRHIGGKENKPPAGLNGKRNLTISIKSPTDSNTNPKSTPVKSSKSPQPKPNLTSPKSIRSAQNKTQVLNEGYTPFLGRISGNKQNAKEEDNTVNKTFDFHSMTKSIEIQGNIKREFCLLPSEP